VEKIKTIGDAYRAAAGLPRPCADHAQRCVRVGLRMLSFVERRNASSSFKWRLRVGVHSGPVVAGIVGKRKYAFDIWGDTVNIASRMESAGEPGRVNVSAYTRDLVHREFKCEYSGGRAKLNTPISGRAAPMGEDRARVFRSTEDEQTTTPEPLSGIQGQGGHRGFGR
jgi:class 3 adenylate cyclase